MKFSEKIAMYREQTGASPQTVGNWMGLSRATYLKREEEGTLVLTDKIIANLEENTGVPAEVWSDETKPLPEGLQKQKSGAGRPRKEVTPQAANYQRMLATRIGQVIRDYFSNNKRSFAQTVLIDEARLSRLLSNKNEISPDVLYKIERNAGVSVVWLQTGQGPVMLKDRLAEPEVIIPHNGQQLIAYLKRNNITYTTLQQALGHKSLSSVTGQSGYTHTQEIRPATQQKIANALKASVRDIFPTNDLISIIPYLEEEHEMMEIPRLPQYARAGLDAERYFEEPVETVRIRLEDLPMNLRKRKWWSVKVNGDSMEPKLSPGDEVYAYWLMPDEWSKVHNSVVIVQHAKQVVIKRIKGNRLETEKGIWLHSDNPEAETFFVPLEDIENIWMASKRIGNI